MEYVTRAVRGYDGMTGLRAAVESDNQFCALPDAKVVGHKTFPFVAVVGSDHGVRARFHAVCEAFWIASAVTALAASSSLSAFVFLCQATSDSMRSATIFGVAVCI